MVVYDDTATIELTEKFARLKEYLDGYTWDDVLDCYDQDRLYKCVKPQHGILMAVFEKEVLIEMSKARASRHIFDVLLEPQPKEKDCKLVEIENLIDAIPAYATVLRIRNTSFTLPSSTFSNLFSLTEKGVFPASIRTLDISALDKNTWGLANNVISMLFSDCFDYVITSIEGSKLDYVLGFITPCVAHKLIFVRREHLRMADWERLFKNNSEPLLAAKQSRDGHKQFYNVDSSYDPFLEE